MSIAIFNDLVIWFSSAERIYNFLWNILWSIDSEKSTDEIPFPFSVTNLTNVKFSDI